MKFRKKPVVIDATQWFKNGDHPDDNVKLYRTPPHDALATSEGEVVRYFRRPDVDGSESCRHDCGFVMHDHGWIDTKEGGHIVCPGDFIITGVQGERYPCKPDIFAATYESVVQSPPPAAETPTEKLTAKLVTDAEQGQLVAVVANRYGWNGVENSKILSTFIEDELKALAALRAVPPPADETGKGWQPIATAPKDGTTVLLWWQVERGRDVVSYWGCGQWREYGDGSKGWSGDSFHCSEPESWTRLLGERPTHWMPLPSAPKGKK